MSTTNDSQILNPNNLPLDKLLISVTDEGVVREVKAIDAYWAEKRPLTLYVKPLDPSSSEPSSSGHGAIEAWKATMEICLDDLQSLLKLEHHRFWSTMIFNSSCMDLLASFLQEANPPYLPSHKNHTVNDLYLKIRRLVLVVFCRLATNKESNSCHINKDKLRDILYDNYIFTIPIIWDICLIYGTDNANTVGRMLQSVFAIQPNYLNDLDVAIVFVKEAFKYVILQVNKDYESEEPPNLPETFKGFSDLSERPSTSNNKSEDNLTQDIVRDLVIHLLDTSMTLKIFVEVYPKSVDVFKRRNVILSIVQVYEYAIPSLYERLDGFSDATYTAHLDCARSHLLDIFREMLAYYTNCIFSGQDNLEKNVEEYLSLLMDGLSECLFIRDYHACYPVQEELEMLRQAYPKLDPIETDYILQAIYANMDDTPPDITQATPNGHLETINNAINATIDNTNDESIPVFDSDIPKNIREESLISEVKDIFPDLGDGFVLKCLQHYGFSSERVINGILEDNLHESLKGLDRNMPVIPEDILDTKFLETGIDRLNVFDGDEFDIMTRDDVDLTKVHKGKRKSKYKDLKAMLDDKTEVKKMADIYSKYNLVCDTEDVYSDEYDDRYDDEGGAPDRTDSKDDLGRPFVTPRVFQNNSKDIKEESEDESATALPTTSQSGAATSANAGRNKLDFCSNPEEIRARREASWQARRGKGHRPPPKTTDVIGKAKGQGQEKEVLHNRDKKEKNKSARANHNRRSGAQWKRSQGMMPS